MNCSIAGCNKIVQHKGKVLCSMHYSRLRRNGDPVKTTRIPHGTAQKFYFEVVLTHEEDRCLEWPFAKFNGYGILGKSKVSIMVCEVANGAKPLKEYHAAHECGNSLCVAKRHLSWKSPKDNNADKIRHGTALRGDKIRQCILNEEKVRQIRMLSGKLKRPEIASLYGVKPSTIGNIFNRSSWSWVKD